MQGARQLFRAHTRRLLRTCGPTPPRSRISSLGHRRARDDASVRRALHSGPAGSSRTTHGAPQVAYVAVCSAQPVSTSSRAQLLTASNRLIWPALAVIHTQRGEVATVLSTVELGEEAAYNMEAAARVTLDQLFGVWRAAVAISKDDTLGARLGMFANPAAPVSWPRPLALFEHLGMAAADLASAIGLYGRFVRLLRDGAQLQLEFEGARAIFHMEVRPEEPPALVEFDLMVSMSIAGRIAMRPLPVQEVWFTHASPAQSEIYAGLFGAPVRFGAPRNAIVGDAGEFRRPLPRANAHVLARLIREAESLLAALPNGELFEDRVCAQIGAELPNGNTNAGAIAEKLGVSARTLHRRLQHEDTSYQELLDRVRQRLAMAHLGAGKAIAQVAELVGFAQASTFHRAFKGWTGETPAEYQTRYRTERQSAGPASTAPRGA